jgi:hypothetical protein
MLISNGLHQLNCLIWTLIRVSALKLKIVIKMGHILSHRFFPAPDVDYRWCKSDSPRIGLAFPVISPSRPPRRQAHAGTRAPTREHAHARMRAALPSKLIASEILNGIGLKIIIIQAIWRHSIFCGQRKREVLGGNNLMVLDSRGDAHIMGILSLRVITYQYF